VLSSVLALAAWSADHHPEIRRHRESYDG